jgi:hypothetical protein
MIRWLYSLFVRCHPHAFRRQFGDQMLSIFEESRRECGSFRLMFDGFVSLLRQWLLRLPQGGVVPRGASLEEIHRISVRLQKRAHRINLAWILSMVPMEIAVAAAVQPITKTDSAQIAYAVLPMAIFFCIYLKSSACETTFTTLQYRGPSAEQLLVRTRDTLQSRLERTGFALVLTLVMWSWPVVLVGLILRSSGVFRSWAFVNTFVFGLQTCIFYFLVSRFDRRALTAVEAEISVRKDKETL